MGVAGWWPSHPELATTSTWIPNPTAISGTPSECLRIGNAQGPRSAKRLRHGAGRPLSASGNSDRPAADVVDGLPLHVAPECLRGGDHPTFRPRVACAQACPPPEAGSGPLGVSLAFASFQNIQQRLVVHRLASRRQRHVMAFAGTVPSHWTGVTLPTDVLTDDGLEVIRHLLVQARSELPDEIPPGAPGLLFSANDLGSESATSP